MISPITVRLYYGGPLWEILPDDSMTGAESAVVLCVRKDGRNEMAIYRKCDLVSVDSSIESSNQAMVKPSLT